MFWFLPPNNVICSGFCLKTNKKQPCLTLLSSPRITWSLPFTAPFIEMTRAAVSTSLSILHFLLLNSYCTLSLINSFVKSVFIVVTNNFQIPSPMEIFHHYSVAVNTVGHSLLRILFFFGTLDSNLRTLFYASLSSQYILCRDDIVHYSDFNFPVYMFLWNILGSSAVSLALMPSWQQLLMFIVSETYNLFPDLSG